MKCIFNGYKYMQMLPCVTYFQQKKGRHVMIFSWI